METEMVEVKRGRGRPRKDPALAAEQAAAKAEALKQRAAVREGKKALVNEMSQSRPHRGRASEGFDLGARLRRLGIKQVHFAAYIGRDPSGVRRWIASNKLPNSPAPPGEIEMLVELLEHHILDHEKPEWLVKMQERYAEAGAISDEDED
jgi:DNA-binding transcriptional regulator YiaG